MYKTVKNDSISRMLRRKQYLGCVQNASKESKLRYFETPLNEMHDVHRGFCTCTYILNFLSVCINTAQSNTFIFTVYLIGGHISCDGSQKWN